MQLVVPIAVKKAVSAATRTFTANSMIFCFFIRFFVFIRWCGGAGVSLSRGWRREITLLRNPLPLEYLFPLLS